MKTEQSTSRPSFRKWMRFSLSSLLIVITAVGLWLGTRVNRVQNEKAALMDFQKNGGMVHFIHQKQSMPWGVDWSGDVESNVPRWMKQLVGEEFFLQLGSVAFVDSVVSDRQLELISRLSALESLSLQGQPNVGDSELNHVKNLTSLENLCLWDTQITDAGLKKLRKLSSLTGLGLSRTRVTDDGLAELANFKRLEILELDGTSISDEGLPNLKDLKALKNLNLQNTQVTQEGVERLKAVLPNCHIAFGSRSVQNTQAIGLPVAAGAPK